MLDMSSPYFPQPLVQPLWIEQLFQVPQTFAHTIAQIKRIAILDFEREVADKQLYYHNHDHITGVQRRAKTIFQVIRPYLPVSVDRDRAELLLDLCAVTHDLIQIFVPQIEPNTARRREAGVSETATIKRLFQYIEEFHQAIQNQNPEASVLFTNNDLQILQEAIAATICDYDPVEQSIFQPALYNRAKPLSTVARVLALADIGALGMEGIVAYNTEGSLLFLEENPDVRSLVEHHKLESLRSDQPDLYENVRQRLLRRARFQVNFAKSRLKRCPQELQGFPPEAIPILHQKVFHYLSSETIQAIEATTPTAESTSLEELTDFFRFNPLMAERNC